LWREIAAQRDQVCVSDIHRNWRYGLNYYSETPLPDCSQEPKPWRLTQEPGRAPVLGRPQPARLGMQPTSLDPLSPGVVLSPFRK